VRNAVLDQMSLIALAELLDAEGTTERARRYISFIKDEQVPLRDGVKILTDVYLPTDSDEPLPAIIAWSPYGKNSGNADRFKALFGLLGLDQKRMSGLQKFEGPDPDFWCANGYAIVYPDPRGIGRSEGDSTMLGTQEGEDGADLVEWVARQPWCNGKVAMSGTSYLSFSQWFIAAERPEHLVCTQVTEALTDGYRDMCLVGGMLIVGYGYRLTKVTTSK